MLADMQLELTKVSNSAVSRSHRCSSGAATGGPCLCSKSDTGGILSKAYIIDVVIAGIGSGPGCRRNAGNQALKEVRSAHVMPY